MNERHFVLGLIGLLAASSLLAAPLKSESPAPQKKPSGDQRTKQDPPPPPVPLTQHEVQRLDAIRGALTTKITLEMVETPLRDAMDQFQSKTGVQFSFDQQALATVGIPLDIPVNFKFSEVSARSALEHILNQLDLTWTVQKDALLITVPENERPFVTLFPVRDLVVGRDKRGFYENADELLEMITATVEPLKWEDVGGAGKLQYSADKGALVCTQTLKAQEQIGELLSALRKARDRQGIKAVTRQAAAGRDRDSDPSYSRVPRSQGPSSASAAF